MSRHLISWLILAFCATAAPAVAQVEEIARFNRITIGTAAPVEGCVPYKDVHIHVPSGQWTSCASDELTFASVVAGGPGGPGGTISGIASSPDGVDSIHYNTITLTNTCGLLGSVTHIDVIAGASGQTCTLPDAALSTTPGRYSIQVVDANPVTVAPTGSNTINAENAPLGPFRGPLAKFDCERRSDTAWYCNVTASVGLGQVVTTHSYVIDETKTNSTTAEQLFPAVYIIPADYITAGKTICIELQQKYVTDAAASLLKIGLNLGTTTASRSAGTTPNNNGTGRLASRWCIYGTDPPGSAVTVRVSPVTHMGAINDVSILTSSPLVATNTELSLVPVAQYNTSTGGESYEITSVVIQEYN